MCAGLIVPSRGVRILAVALAILWEALPMPDMIGRSGTPGLWVLGNPYIWGRVGWYSISLDHDLFSSFSIFLRDLLNSVVSLSIITLVVSS